MTWSLSMLGRPMNFEQKLSINDNRGDHQSPSWSSRNVPTVIIGGKVKSSTDASIGGLRSIRSVSWILTRPFLGRWNRWWILQHSRPGRRICQACDDYRKCEKDLYLADDSKIGVTSFVKSEAPYQAAMIITNQCEPQRLKVLKKNGGYRGWFIR